MNFPHGEIRNVATIEFKRSEIRGGIAEYEPLLTKARANLVHVAVSAG